MLFILASLAWATPDLQVLSIAGPSSAAIGAPATFTVRVRNNGTAFTQSVDTAIRLSLDASYFFLDDPEICTLTTPTGWAAGQTITLTDSCEIPYTASAGSWYIVTRTGLGLSTESDYLNNDGVYGPVQIAGVGGDRPDLRAVNVNAPASAVAGAAITVSWTLRNDGLGQADPSTTGLFLSPDSALDAGDVALCEEPGPAVAAGNGQGDNASCTIPAGTPPGAWFVLAVADYDDQLDETNEGNNVGADAINLTGPAPSSDVDLLVTALQAPSTSVPGATLSIDTTVRNAGADAAPATVLRLRLSADDQWDGGDTLLCERTVPALAAGATNQAPITGCTIPSEARGAGFIIARVDPDQGVAEADEGNNDRSAPLTLAEPSDGPDLAVTRIVAPNVPTEGAFTVSYELTNVGDRGAGAHRARVYFSTDAAWGGNDALLCTDDLSGVPATTTVRAEVTGCTLPAGTPAGPGWLIVWADADDDIDEASEVDNLLALAVEVTEGAAQDTAAPPADDEGGGAQWTTIGCQCGHARGPGWLVAVVFAFALRRFGRR